MIGRLLAATGMALVLAGAGLLAWGHLGPASEHRFFGDLRIGAGGAENIVARPSLSTQSDAEAAYESPYVQLAGADIPFMDIDAAKSWVDPQRFYDAAALPFYLELREIRALDEPSPGYSIEISGPDGADEQAIVPGGDLSVAGEAYRVEELRRWRGLLREPRESGGVPMAMVAVGRRGETWLEDILLVDGQWARIEPLAATLRLVWVDNEEEARTGLAKGFAGLDAARWGVQDGGVTHWFESFAPGTGLELDDGREVTLLGLDETRAGPDGAHAPALLYEVRAGGESRREWAFANAAATESLVRFDHPARADALLVLYVWRDDYALAGAYRAGDLVGSAEIGSGAVYAAPLDGLELRLDQATGAAVFVGEAASPLWEAVLRSEDRVLRLREGEAVRVGDLLVRFRMTVEPASRTYLLCAHDGQGSGRGFELPPRGAVRLGAWRLAQGPADPRLPDMAFLYVEHVETGRAGTLGQLLFAGGLAIVGLLVVARIIAALRARRRGA